MNQLNSWSTQYKVPYDMVLDIDRVIAKYVPPDDSGGGYPMNIVIRTDTMQITYAAIGATTDALQDAINAILSSQLDGAVIGRPTGAACTSDKECLGTTPHCTTVDANSTSWPGGSCTSKCMDTQNDPTTGINPKCPGGAGTCLGGSCFSACTAKTGAMPCERSGYSCFDPGTCLPTSLSNCVPFQANACPDTPQSDGGAPRHNTCVPAGPDPVGICLDGCSVFAQDCPLDGTSSPQACYAVLQSGEGYCIPPGLGVDGDSCQYPAECAPGFGCQGDKSGGHCRPWCGGPGNVACPSSRVCTDLSGTVSTTVVGMCAGP
jgi:hypothetical protein